jgi:sarcosine oxidase subunit alpha
MTRDLRIREHHALAFDRGREVTIFVDGKPVRAYENEPVAVALFAAGRTVLARSLRFHRPRGAFCLAGACASCAMEVDGVPGVRTCRTYPKGGMTVVSRGGFPKVTNDFLFASDFLLRKGFNYHHLLTRPRFLNRLLVGVVRRMATEGKLPPTPAGPPPVLTHRACDVAVVGAGPAGVAAALAAAEGGRSVVLIDEEPAVGGRLRFEVEAVELPGVAGAAPGREFAANMPGLLAAAKVEVLARATAAGRYADGVLLVVREGESIALRPGALVVCAGAMDQNVPFAGNDLPRVMSARAVRRLTNVHGLCPAVATLIVGTDADALSLALRLPEIGVRVVGIVEPGTRIMGPRAMATEAQRRGVPLFLSYRIARALGRFHLTGARLEPVAGGEPITLRCDLIAVAGRNAPAYQLLDQAGCDLRLDPARGGFVAELDEDGRTNVPGVLAAGEVTGATDLGEIVRQGRAAGLAASDWIGSPSNR